MKPDNPYRKGSLLWSVMEGDWEDLTLEQIAEVLVTNSETIRSYLVKIKRETGYEVPHVHPLRKGGKYAQGTI